MLGKCFCVITLVSFVFAVCLGNTEALAVGAIDGASKAVSTVISLSGMMCLWCGIMNVFRKAGLVTKLSKLLTPVLKLIFPDAFKTGIAKDEITWAVSANLLGIGNAATPFALSAMKKMDKINKKPSATDDMIMLTVLATSPVCFLPTTLITLRRAAGSCAPYKIVIPVWIGSLCTSIFAVILCRLCAIARKTAKTRCKKESSKTS